MKKDKDKLLNSKKKKIAIFAVGAILLLVLILSIGLLTINNKGDTEEVIGDKIVEVVPTPEITPVPEPTKPVSETEDKDIEIEDKTDTEKEDNTASENTEINIPTVPEDIEETTDDKEVKEEKPIESEPVVEKPSVDDKETKKEDKKDTEKDKKEDKKEDKKDTEKDKKEDKKEDKKDTEKDKKDKVENNDKDNIDKDKKEPTATPTPKAEPTKKPTQTPTQKPKPTPTPKPTATPTPEPKPTEEPKPTKAPTNKAKTEKFYGVEIVGVDKFVDPKEGWKNNYEDLSKLDDVLDEKYPDKSGLYIYSSRLEFSHLDSTSPAIILKADNNEYQLVLKARLKVVNEYGIEDEAKLNRDMLKIFLMKITPDYETVYNDIYRDAEVDYVFSEDKWTKSGDTKIKVEVKNGEVIYHIKSAN